VVHPIEELLQVEIDNPFVPVGDMRPRPAHCLMRGSTRSKADGPPPRKSAPNPPEAPAAPPAGGSGRAPWQSKGTHAPPPAFKISKRSTGCGLKVSSNSFLLTFPRGSLGCLPAGGQSASGRAQRRIRGPKSRQSDRPPEASPTGAHPPAPNLLRKLLQPPPPGGSCFPGHPPTRPPCAAFYPVLGQTLACSLQSAFRPCLATMPLRFVNASPASSWIEDRHRHAAVDHVRHTDHMKWLLGFHGACPGCAPTSIA
jgi:hypothetical protein